MNVNFFKWYLFINIIQSQLVTACLYVLNVQWGKKINYEQPVSLYLQYFLNKVHVLWGFCLKDDRGVVGQLSLYQN